MLLLDLVNADHRVGLALVQLGSSENACCSWELHCNTLSRQTRSNGSIVESVIAPTFGASTPALPEVHLPY
jgi:hypothetical protein